MTDTTPKTVEKMNEQAMVDELIDDHGLERYDGKKIETTHWGKEDLQKLVISAREVQKAIDEGQGKSLDDMERDDFKKELSHREVEFAPRTSTKKLIEMLRESRINYAMIAFGHGEAAGVGSTDPSDVPPSEAEVEAAKADDDREKPPAAKPRAPAAATVAITPKKLKECCDNALHNLLTPAAKLDIKNALAMGHIPTLQATLILPNAKRVNLRSRFES